MLNLLFFAVLMSVGLSFFNFSYSLSGVGRAFLGSYKAVGESSVIAYQESGEGINPYFSVELFQKAAGQYFAEALRNYTDDYSLSYDFWDPETGQEDYEFPRKAGFTLKCSLPLSRTFARSALFSIKSKNHG